jgi:putative membrane-bound dehydrogenase-like protein
MSPRLALLAALLCPLTVTAADKPVPTAQAAAKFTVPPGFNVTLFAGEPDIVQPIAFTFDDRGRMWLVECMSYPKWRDDGKGTDRVVILEDTDGDGKHDKKTVVIDDGVNLSGIEVGFGGVWLCSTPNFLFVPIKDDKPSGPPQVLLDGWNLKEAKHNVFNGLAWGPDGWLYGCNGIQTKSHVGKPGTPREQRTFFDCGIWRYHPTKKVFDIVAVGMTNPWGIDWDERGEMFATNCVIDHLWHVVPGGHYQRMYGSDANPYAFGQMTSAVDYKHWGGGHWTDARADIGTGAIKAEHDAAGGGHAHSGCAIYLGDQFPAAYRDTLFTCNIHGNRLNNDGLERTPAGMKGVRRPDFAFAHDPWFRGIAVKQGPDGSLFVCDWSDTGECHNYETVDRTGGRVYRIAYGQPKPWDGDVSTMTDAELVAAQASKNEWLVRCARRVLQERAAADTTLDATKLVAMTKSPDEVTRLRAYWALECVGKLTENEHDGMTQDKAESVRAWATRFDADTLLTDSRQSPQAEAAVGRLTRSLSAEKSPFVRAALAGTLQRLDGHLDGKTAAALVRHAGDNADPNLTLLEWLALTPYVSRQPNEALALATRTPIHRVRTNVVREVLTLPQTDATGQLEKVVGAIRGTQDSDTRRDMLAGVQLAFEGRRDVTAPTNWPALAAELAAGNDPALRQQGETVAVLLGDKATVAALLARVGDPSKPAADRAAAIQTLRGRRVPGLADALRKLLTDPQLRAVAIRGLVADGDTATASALLAAYSSFNAGERADAVQTLSSRPAFALALLNAVKSGTVPRGDISTFAARQLLALKDKAVAKQVAEVWGTVRPASATRVEQTKKLKAALTPAALAQADRGNGRRLYAVNCASCHKLFGDGGDVGPELTGSQRASLDYVLENVLDPSAVVPGDYRLTTFALIDGRTVSGIVRKETPRTVTIRTLNEEVTIPTADIEKRVGTALSIMPDGLLDSLTEAEVRDLVGYLASPKQVAASAGK